MTGLGETAFRMEDRVVALIDRVRRAWLLGRIRAMAFRRRSQVKLDVAPDLRVGRRVTVKLARRTHVSLQIAPRCRIGDDVVLMLMSGSVTWGEDVQLRFRSTVDLSGHLWCEGGNIFSYGTAVHCAESIRLHQQASCSEYVTLADSAHFYTEPEVHYSENTVSGPIEIGPNVFLAPRVSVNRNVTIGGHTIVGPNSVVVGDLPSGSFASGIPARVVRSLELPWVAKP
jgi:acetyltransferase-like isoleucine patch superfamily enzyme